MTELTLQQRQALALAKARRSRAAAQSSAPMTAQPSIPIPAPAPQDGTPESRAAENLRLSGMDFLAPKQHAWDTPLPRGPAMVGPQDPELLASIHQNDVASRQTPLSAKLQGIAAGGALSANDEIGAALISPFTSDSYGQVLDTLRQSETAAAEQYPGAYYSGMGLGGLIAPGALGGKVAAGGRSLIGMMGRGAGMGTLGGAVQGFMGGQDGLANRAQGSLLGGAFGAAMGAAAPLVGAGVKAAIRGGSNLIRNARVGSQIGKELGVSNSAARVLSNIIGSDDPAAISAALARSGPNAMLADVSPQATGMLDMAMRSPIPAARMAGQAVEARASGAYDDVLKALDGSMGSPTGIKAAQSEIVKGSAPARKVAYDAAYAAPIDYSAPAGAKLLDEITPRIPKDAIDYANKLMRLKGEKSPQIMATIAENGAVSFSNPPDVRQWDYIKQGLDMAAESGDGAGALGGQTRVGSAYQGLAREVRDAVGQLVPEYKTALGVASDAITERNAVDFGSKLLRSGTTPEMAADAISGASKAELEAMRKGVRSQIQNTLGDVRKVASDQNLDARSVSKAFSDLSSENARKKLELLMGNDWPALRDQLDQSGAALGLRARTSANSATFGRGAAEGAVIDEVTPGALRRGQPINAVKETIAGLLGASPTAIRRMGDEVKGEIADVLTRQGNGAPQAAISSIVNALSKSPINTEAGKGVRRVIEALMLGNTGMASSELQGRLALQKRGR